MKRHGGPALGSSATEMCYFETISAGQIWLEESKLEGDLHFFVSGATENEKEEIKLLLIKIVGPG